MSSKLILKELQHRAAAAKKAAEAPTFLKSNFCFPKQLDFINDTSIIKTAVTSRRAGKSTGIAADFIDACLNERDIVCLYITLTFRSAKNIIWNEFKRICEDYKLNVKIDEQRLSILFLDTRSEIRCGGAKDESEIEKYRGWKLRKAYVDECFHPDTLVKTDKGYLPIKDIKIGDRVFNCTGLDTVTEVSKKIKKEYIELTFNGKVVKCSLEHPFFTERGWQKARDLQIGENLISENASVYLLSENFSEAGAENLQILQSCLLGEMGTSKSAESYGEPRNYSEIKKYSKVNWAQASGSWWKWSWANCTRAFNIKKIPRTKVEPCDWFRKSWEWISFKLQSRFSSCREENSYRGGRPLSLCNIETTAGQKERNKIEFIRLENTEIKKCSSDESNRDGVFYDIGVSKHPSFIVNGVLVHNCQSFRPYLKFLIEDILIPGLRDLNGELGLTGTPGPVLAGLFYEYSINPKIKNYHWTAFDNPHMHNPPKKDLNKRLEQERDLRGILETDAGYQRETYGKWVEDKDALVFKFNKNINIYSQLPQQEMVYIFGMDIGWNDCDAIAVLGYNYVDNKVYLVEEFVRNHQTITDFVSIIKSLRDKYKPIKMVMDAGALGKKIQEEIKQRHGIVVEAADKHRKFEFIELLNDDLRTGRFKTFAGSRFEQDTNLVVWDNSKFGKREISDIYHTDIGDAVLYGFRECKHYYQIGHVSKPAINTNEYMDMLEELEAEKLAKQMAGENDNVSDSDLQSVFDIYGNDDDFI